ncbi:hypothetical protein [Paraflavitalea sp. CAU 1676]|uniref:hypothetical protein n=1 Tax=Paraflavitalea sp. CAU 1676 TaxID=3032598 RepID=UPI0023DC34F6|nr:hypothetical protein [Paraflavitalea sp. CAU 1676]MDF2192366.1 hypothetical protein [Paraflavitalea sp. CAU 1676]
MSSMLSGSAIAQDRVFTNVQEEIKRKGIDTAVIYTAGYVGFFILSKDTCKKEATRYLFFQKQGRHFVQRFDFCGTAQPTELPAGNLVGYFLANADSLKVEEIQLPTFSKKTIMRGDKLVEETEIQIISHHGYYELILKTDRGEVKKHIPNYYLTIKDDGNGKKNIYYESNLQTKLYALIQKIEAYINQNR